MWWTPNSWSAAPVSSRWVLFLDVLSVERFLLSSASQRSSVCFRRWTSTRWRRTTSPSLHRSACRWRGTTTSTLWSRTSTSSSPAATRGPDSLQVSECNTPTHSHSTQICSFICWIVCRVKKERWPWYFCHKKRCELIGIQDLLHLSGKMTQRTLFKLGS